MSRLHSDAKGGERLNCPECHGPLVEVAVRPACRPHVRCQVCNRVYVPHEGCRDFSLRGLHPCRTAGEHVLPAVETLPPGGEQTAAMCHFDELRPGDERFVVEKSTARDHAEWPWTVRDRLRGWITAKCSNEATARSAAAGLNRDEAARSRASPKPSSESRAPARTPAAALAVTSSNEAAG